MRPRCCFDKLSLPLVVDTSVAINLNATGYASAVIKAIPNELRIVDVVHEELNGGAAGSPFFRERGCPMMTDQIRERIDKRDAALEVLNRLRGMFGAVGYLMGGESRRLEGEYADLETWFGDVQDRLEQAIGIVEELPMGDGGKESGARSQESGVRSRKIEPRSQEPGGGR